MTPQTFMAMLVVGALVLGAWLVNVLTVAAPLSAPKQTAPVDAPDADAPAQLPDFEIDIVTNCDMAAERQLLAPDSMDLAWKLEAFAPSGPAPAGHRVARRDVDCRAAPGDRERGRSIRRVRAAVRRPVRGPSPGSPDGRR
jgi:hypothetical protein